MSVSRFDEKSENFFEKKNIFSKIVVSKKITRKQKRGHFEVSKNFLIQD